MLLPRFLPLQNGPEKHWEGFLGVCINLPHFLIFFGGVSSSISSIPLGGSDGVQVNCRGLELFNEIHQRYIILGQITATSHEFFTSKGSVLEGKSPYFREI